MSDASATDPVLADIHAGLERDGYYVDATLSQEFSEAQLAELRDDLGSADPTTYVVAFPLRDTDQFRGSASDLLTRLHDAYPEPAVYLSTTTSLGSDDEPIRLEGRQFDLPSRRDGTLDDYQVTDIVRLEEPADLGTAFLRSVELLDLDSETLGRLATQAREESDDRDGGAGSGGPDATGVVVTLIPVAIAAAVALVVVRRRRRGLPAFSTPSPGPRTDARPSAGAVLSLPAATLDRIRDAQDRRLVEEARDEVLELGVSIDRVRLTTEVERAGWQVAVDHYQAARDLLERLQYPDHGPDVLEVVGALVLARRAQEALLAIRRGRAWEPQAPCFLNPLHPRATAQASLERAAGAAMTGVPVCEDCKADLEAGRRPSTLEGRRLGRLVPYYESGAEPWVSTGYGALEPDLLSAVLRHAER